jgi:hypothetical protein
MYARVARWEGGEPEAIRRTADEIDQEVKSGGGPPEGVPAAGMMLLTDPDTGRVMFVSLFETEEDRRKGDETLNAMSPPGDGMGRRAAVEFYDVAVEARMQGAAG